MIYEKPELEMLRFVVEAGFAQSLNSFDGNGDTDTDYEDGGTFDDGWN